MTSVARSLAARVAVAIRPSGATGLRALLHLGQVLLLGLGVAGTAVFVEVLPGDWGDVTLQMLKAAEAGGLGAQDMAAVLRYMRGLKS